ncbi:MAG: alanine racemase, partial [Acidimicrobiaceae bacterium]|nr:alanine racemase [Acidimicrobiaceae bacterium]
GESVSYGRHWWADEPTRVATVAIGYADGIRRDSGAAGVEVLVRGRRCPIVGAVTMDQLMVALPPAIADEATLGDEAVLIGRQGADEITATEVAQRLGTIAYEVLTSISSRVPRVPG